MTMITGEQTKDFHFLQCLKALELEVRTGMKFSNRGSVLAMAKHMKYTDKGTKAAAAKQMREAWDKAYPKN